MRVLIVDDDPIACEQLRAMVQANGFEAEVSGSGIDALAALHDKPVPIVLTDRIMPDLDGLQLCRMIRRKPCDDYIYIIVVSSEDNETDIHTGLDAGADDYLSKSDCSAQLPARLQTAQRILQLERSVRAMARKAEEATARLRLRAREHSEQLAIARACARNSEARFAGIIESAMDAIISVDAQQRVILFNAASEAMFRCPAEAAIGAPLSRFIPIESRAAHAGHVERFGRTAATSRSMHSLGELTALRSDGSQFPIEASISQTSAHGRHIYTVILRDITQRRQMELSLRESEERLRQIAESLPQLIWTATPEGGCDFLGHQWEQYTGVPAERQLGNGWIERVHPDERPALTQAWQAALRDGTEFRAEFRLQDSSGAYRWFDARAAALRDAQGRIAKWFGSNVDVDERRRAHEMQLRSQKMEALGTLAGGIAHDFNNILLAIRGNAQLAIADLDAGHRALESLSEIDRAGSRATDLVRRILSFARQEEPRHEVIQLRPVVEEALELLRRSLPAMIEVRTRFAAPDPAIIGDSSQVHQIIMNVVANAAHAIGARPGRIEIVLDAANVDAAQARATPGLRAGAYARLAISDTGCGMDTATLQRIFDPFFTTKPVGQGTGLGLSAVDGIMKGHGGAVSVDSQPGKGSTFCFYFPVTQRSADAPAASCEPLAQARGQRVLYVDDDDALVFLMTRMLSRIGYVVTGSEDPREALLKVRAAPDAFDAVVTDLSMPGMPGTELARQILSLRPDLPVIVTSGYVRDEDLELVRQIGAAALIPKPNSIEELGAALDAALRIPPQRDSARRDR